MARAAQQEQGHMYPKEAPSSYNKGQTGKGVSISGKVTAKGGTPLQVSDPSAGKLKKIWSKAMNAAGKFGKF